MSTKKINTHFNKIKASDTATAERMRRYRARKPNLISARDIDRKIVEATILMFSQYQTQNASAANFLFQQVIETVGMRFADPIQGRMAVRRRLSHIAAKYCNGVT